MMPSGISEGETARKLLEHHRNIVRILPSYPKILKVINADQPCVDVFYQGKPRWPLTRPVPVSLHLEASRACLGAGESSCGRPRVPAQKQVWGSQERPPRRPWASTLHPERSPDLTWSEERWGQGGRARGTQACPGTSPVVQWSHFAFQCRGPEFDPWEGN